MKLLRKLPTTSQLVPTSFVNLLRGKRKKKEV